MELLICVCYISYSFAYFKLGASVLLCFDLFWVVLVLVLLLGLLGCLPTLVLFVYSCFGLMLSCCLFGF